MGNPVTSKTMRIGKETPNVITSNGMKGPFARFMVRSLSDNVALVQHVFSKNYIIADGGKLAVTEAETPISMRILDDAETQAAPTPVAPSAPVQDKEDWQVVA